MWTENVSVYALHEAGVDERIIAMWAELRPAVLYFLRHRNGQHKAAHIRAAQTHLLKFAQLAHEHFGLDELATFQLHTCMVHLGEQARECGPVAFAAEWWIERLMQVRVVTARLSLQATWPPAWLHRKCSTPALHAGLMHSVKLCIDYTVVTAGVQADCQVSQHSAPRACRRESLAGHGRPRPLSP